MSGFAIRSLATDQRRPSAEHEERRQRLHAQNGSPNQSHSCPLLSRISQQTIVSAQQAQPERVEAQRLLAHVGSLRP